MPIMCNVQPCSPPATAVLFDYGEGSPSARILIHHADAQHFETRAPPVCGDTCSETAWEIHPSGSRTTDINSSLPVESLLLMPPSSTTKLPLEVMVRWVYGTRDRQNYTSAGTSAAELPSFLKDASNDVIKKYFEKAQKQQPLQITNNPTLTKGDVKNALKRWKMLLSTDLLKKYDEAEAEMAQKLAEERDRQSQRIRTLSIMAKQVAEQIEAPTSYNPIRSVYGQLEWRIKASTSGHPASEPI
uniref:HMG box domain-containing protein n=1 Tax=Angiostrongylus cantonensis TaxID=6313 RepID=A0A0K0DLL2_ANGCA